MTRRFRPLQAVQNAWMMGGMRITRLDVDRYEAVAARISLDRSREGTDGVCCFLTPKEAVPKPRTTDRCLVIGSMTAEPGEASPGELLREHGLPMVRRSDACVELQVEPTVAGDQLRLRIGCGIHATRPQICRDYPDNVGGGPCTYEKYAATPQLQVDRAGYAALFLYAFAQDLYPQLGPFALGEAVRFRRRYWLIPVPVAQEKACGFCPKGLAGAGPDFASLLKEKLK